MIRFAFCNDALTAEKRDWQKKKLTLEAQCLVK